MGHDGDLVALFDLIFEQLDLGMALRVIELLCVRRDANPLACDLELCLPKRAILPLVELDIPVTDADCLWAELRHDRLH